ncbi:hypothetical protein JYT59_01705, partial [Sphingobacteriaceae bacterium AH-315-L07]|nr:hypothetical protein [Sphingobacteriaceae bacterium AH-315-L07]
MKTFFKLILFNLVFQLTFNVYGQGTNNLDQNINVKTKSDQVISNKFCATDHLTDILFKKFPSLKQRQEAIDRNIYLIKTGSQRSNTVLASYTIPMVVHIIHNNGSENIPDNQVIDGIQHLNDAFANVGFYDPTTGVDVEIDFCLAKQDENGEFTTGINRVQSSLTDMIMETQDLDVKNLIRWDPTEYLNFWLVNTITSQSMGPGVAGYAYFPSSHGNPEDGIVVESYLFGSSEDNSKVHVHEVGHYLGLYHTFQDGCASNNCLKDGDKVCDTPPDASTASVSCNTSINTCTTDEDDTSANNPFRPISLGGLGDQDDMFINYMDYGFQDCQSAFTAGQKDRMTISISVTRSSLLLSTTCVDPCTTSISSLFLSSDTIINIDSLVSFSNTSTGATDYTWQIDGITFSTAQDTSYVFKIKGAHTITLIASNGDPTCIKEYSKTIQVVCPFNSSFTASATNVTFGYTVDFTNNTTGATSYEWFLDGVSQGS